MRHKVRGATRAGVNYSALAAAYPPELNQALITVATKADEDARSRAGGIKTHPLLRHAFSLARELHANPEDSLENTVARLVSSLREVAVGRGLAEQWENAVDPWVQSFSFHRAEKFYANAAARVDAERPRFSTSPS